MQTESTLINSFILQNIEEQISDLTKKVNNEFELSLSENAVRHRVRRLRTNVGREMAENGIDPSTVSKYWYRGKNMTFEVTTGVDLDSFREKLIDDLKREAPKSKPIKYSVKKDPHLFILDPADIHFGKLGMTEEVLDEYNLDIAKERVINGCNELLHRAANFNLDRVLLVLGNDILHVDNAKQSTTSGTLMDCSSTFWNAYRVAKNCCVTIINELKKHAPVDVLFCPSNHDFVSGFMLLDSIASWFHHDKNVSFDCRMIHRKYYQYGQNLIGLTHGDGAKENDLPQLMANESKLWDSTKFRYFYCHHIHSMKKVKWQSGKDYIGVAVEYLRSCSGTDRWHFSNGYVGVPKAVEGFIHHPDKGQVAKISHYF